MSLKRIRLELARTPDHPNGSPSFGYEFVAPLDDKGHLASVEWPTQKGACTVRRFWNGTPDEHGALIHRRDGSWAFSYAPGNLGKGAVATWTPRLPEETNGWAGYGDPTQPGPSGRAA